MAADCCIICDVTLGEDAATCPAGGLQRVTRLLQMVVEPVCDNHVKPCSACGDKMSQVEAVLEELRAAYCETRKTHCSPGWTEDVMAEDERLYHKKSSTVVQTQTVSTQTDEPQQTEVSKGRSQRKSSEPRQVKQETKAESPTPVNNLTCPVCGDRIKTQGGFRRHLKNHAVGTVLPNTPRIKTERQSGPAEETGTPGRRGRPLGSKAEKKKEEKESEKVEEVRTHVLHTLQDHMYSELSPPSAGNLPRRDTDDDDNDADYVMAADDMEYDVTEKKTPRRKYRRRVYTDGGVTGPPYECDVCQKVFKIIYDLERHQQMVHSNPTERFACDQCDVTFKWKQSLKAHQKTHRDTPPAEDGSSVRNDNTDNKEQQNRRKSGDIVGGPPFVCDTCGKVFKVIYDLERHQQMVHSNPTERYACDQCDVTFKWKQSLKAHKKTHRDAPPTAEAGSDSADDILGKDDLQNKTPGRKSRRVRSAGVVSGPPFTCETCQKVFNIRRDLERHRQMVHCNPTERFACDQCDATFKWKQSLKAHVKRHTESATATNGNEENDADLEQRETQRRKYRKKSFMPGPPFECERCNKIFKYRQVLERHQRMLHHSDVTERFPCTQCDRTFKWKQSLRAHQRLHSDTRPFVCSLCPKAFRSAGTLKQHALSHEGTKLYQCHICNSAFTRSMRLQIHLRSHTGELPYVCEQCGRGFADPQIFKRHMRNHNGERPYICTDCGKGFTMARYLSEHRKAHTGQREYLCATCGAAFANSGRLRRHMEVHGTKRHACTLCDKTYKHKEALDSHMNIHMGIKPHVCGLCQRSFTHRSGLRQHALLHSAQPKPFRCSVCSKQFSTKAKVRRHAALHGEKQVSKGVSRVYEIAVEDASVDILETHNDTYDGTVVLEIADEAEAFVPPVAAVEEADNMEETAAEASAASQSLLQVLTQQQQQQQASPAPRVHHASPPPSIQVTSSKLKAHLSRGQPGAGEAGVDADAGEREVMEEAVQVIEYQQDEQQEEGTQTIILQPAAPGATSSLGQIYQVVGSGGNILYQIQQ